MTNRNILIQDKNDFELNCYTDYDQKLLILTPEDVKVVTRSKIERRGGGMDGGYGLP